MNTEITDNSGLEVVNWVAYDSECGFCTALAGHLEAALRRRGFGLVPLQTPWVLACLGRTPEEATLEMKLFIRGGRVLGGADAVVELGKSIWMFRPLVWIADVPGGRRFLKWGYGWVARHRRCAPGSCRVPQAFTSGRTRTL